MRIASLTAAGLLATGSLAGCGNSTNQAAGPSEVPPSPSAASSSGEPSVGGKSLRETCPEVETVVAKVDPLMDSYSKVDRGAQRLVDLYRRGDTETRNALEGFAEAFVEPFNAEAGGAKLAAEQAYIDAIDALADLCAGAGSSALQ